MLFVIGFVIGCLFLVMFFKSKHLEKNETKTATFLEALGSGVKTAIFTASFVGLALIAAAPSFLGVIFLTTASVVTISMYLVIGFIVGSMIPLVKRLMFRDIIDAGEPQVEVAWMKDKK
jgi:hypothetical protein